MFRNSLSRESLPAWVLLCVGIATSVFASQRVRHDIEADAAAAFAFACDQVAIKVRERLAAHELILRGGAALFAASEKVERRQWQAYVETVQAQRILPGVQGIGFSLLIPADRLAEHVAGMRAQGSPDYTVNPPGPRAVYSSIVYLEPWRDRNLRAIGYDMFSEPVRRAAMEKARDTGEAALSGKVRLVQETDTEVQPGTLMYVPVYRNGMPVETLEQRRAALLGWSYSPYRMKDLMSGILLDWEHAARRGIHLRIHDGSDTSTASLLFDSNEGKEHAERPSFGLRRLIDFHGSRWVLSFDHDSIASDIDYSQAWSVLAGGFAVSGLLFALLLSLIHTRRTATRIADDLTADLRQRELLLLESESRWRFAIDGAGDGLWDWNVAEGKVFFSSRWKEMLGHEDHEIGDGLDEWERRIHPDDKARTLGAVQAYFSGETPTYVCEHRVRCKDGSYKWVLDRGMVVSRDEAGKPLRMIGTHSDISAAKAMEALLMRHRAELQEAQRIAQVGSWTLDLATGKVAWSPELHRMLGLDPAEPPPSLDEHPRLFAAESWSRLEDALARARSDGTPYELRLETIRADGSNGWMLARGEAVRDAQGAVVVLRGIAYDITEREHARIRIEQLTNLYSALSECNEAVAHCTTQEGLFARICEVVVTKGRMKMAWIGLADEATGRVPPVQAFGDGTEYLDGIRISVDADDPHGRGPTGTAVRENHPVWLDDFLQNPSTAPWHDRAAPHGWKASAALPISRGGRPVGALTFYAGTHGWFDPETRALLEEMAANISFALDKFDAEATARAHQATLIESEQRFRSLVEQSIAGIYIIQDGKVAYANPRTAEILGYPDGDALLGRPPADFVAPRDRPALEQSHQKLLSGELSRSESLFSALRPDGSTVDVAVTRSMAAYRSRPAIIGLMQDLSDRKVAEDQIRRYAKQLEQTFIQTVGLATRLSEMRDPYTAGHEQRVAEIAVAIGREMGLDEDRLKGLRVGGHLHDVGKITVPTEILAKPGRLTPLEYALIQQHAQAGYDVLKEVSFPWPVAQIALQHHERVDGSGYPQGLAGDAILLEARITAVADVVESMASHRPYRSAVGIDAALAEIERGRGSAYDPVVADTCLRLFREMGFVIPD